MAAAIKSAVSVEPDLVEGARGEFTVWVGDRVVAKKTLRGFPTDEEIVRAVREASGDGPSTST